MLNNEQLIEQMTLEEKASLMSGKNFWQTKSIERLNVPSIMLTDGPHGLRKQGGKADHLGLNKSIPATCFPTAATLANSWDRDLLNKVGKAIGKEARAEQVNVLLGPGMNIKRNPLGGRNFEYFSEDPHLTGVLANAMVEGIQSNGIAACPKHFAVNSQEHMRMSIDEIVDERSLREIYLSAFEMTIKNSKPKTLMTSYNRVNGIFANEHPHLSNQILHEEWGFEGVVVTDWGGNHDRVAGLKAFNQLEMPSTNGITDREIVNAVKNGELDEAVLDGAVDRIITLIKETEISDQVKGEVDFLKHHEFATEVAEQSIVLLKNEENILPLSPTKKIAVIGDFAKTPRYQGAGSSLINPTKIDNALDCLQASSLNIIGYAQGFQRIGKINEKLVEEAKLLANKADTILVFLGLDESREAEGVDRVNLQLAENQLHLLKGIIEQGKEVIVCLSGGGVIEMPFEKDVQGIIHMYLPGQGGGQAITNILEGKVNPSGKLSESFPYHYEDVSSAPYFPGKEATSEHREGLFVGYRYFDTASIPVQFPFGFGLSYTQFVYENIKVNGYDISFDVVNIGEVPGAEITQLYVCPKQTSIIRAKRELKHFDKVFLEPNERKTLYFTLTDRDFSYYDVRLKDWVIEKGDYEIQIGSSIEHIHLTANVFIDGVSPNTALKSEYPTYALNKIQDIPTDEYYKLLGFVPNPEKWDYKKPLTLDDTIAQAQYKNWLGKLLYKTIMAIHHFYKKRNKPLTANNVFFILNMRFGQIERFSGGKVSKKNVKRFLKWIN